MERMSERPWEEFCIAVAGPAVNVVIAILLFLVLHLAKVGYTLEATVQSARIDGIEANILSGYGFGVCLMLGALLSNIFLVLFNMIPAFPMDGGRVFRALLASVMDRLRATEVAAMVGMVVAAMLGLLGLLQFLTTGFPFMMALSIFVLFAGQQELLAVRYREAVRRRRPSTCCRPTHPGRRYSLQSNYLCRRWYFRYIRSPFTRAELLRLHLGPPASHWIEWREGRPVHVCSGKGEWGTGNGEWGRVR